MIPVPVLLAIIFIIALILAGLALVARAALLDCALKLFCRHESHPWYRVMSRERAALIYRAMNGDKEAQQVVTLQDVADLENAPSFEKFLQWNQYRIEAYDAPADGVPQAQAGGGH